MTDINTDINMKNYQGETLLYIIIKNDFWKNILNILENKKLDIFITTNDKKNIFNILKDSDINNFIEIVSKSYLNQIWNHYM